MKRSASILIVGCALLAIGCQKKPKLFNPDVDTAKVPEPLHIAHVDYTKPKQWTPDFAACLNYEPGIEWYNSYDTFRLIRDRKINPAPFRNAKTTQPLLRMQDFDFILVTLPRGEGAVVRSFRFGTGTVAESYVTARSFSCTKLYRWLNLTKVFSIPDRAFLFVDRRFRGLTPRWQALPDGNYTLRAETYDDLVGELALTIPGPTNVTIKHKKGEELKRDGGGMFSSDNDASIAFAYILGTLAGLALTLLPIFLF